MDAPPLPKKKRAVFHHPTLGIDLYDGLAMDLHAMTYAEPLLKEVERLRALIADIKAWDVSQYVAIPHELRVRMQAALPANDLRQRP